MSEEVEVLKEQSSKVAQWAAGMIVANKCDADIAVAGISRMKTVRAQWVAYWEPIKSAASAAHKAICAKEKEGTEGIDAAEKIVKAKITAWQNAEQEKAMIEQRRLQAIADEQARKEREKAEAAAAVQRAKEAAAREAEQAALRKAQEATNEADRIKAQAEADKASRAAEAAAQKAEVKQEQAMVEAPIITVESPKMAGSTTTWKAELISITALTGLAITDIRLPFVVFNQQAADRFAKATKGAIPVAGIRFVPVSGLSIRKQ